MKNLLSTSALVAVSALAVLMPPRPARAQQGFNSGGLNTCSIIYNQNLQAISTCYGYINGTPTFFTQQPTGSNLALQFDNFIGQTGHSPAPISISTSGSVTIAGGIAFGGTINVALPGIRWNLPNPHFTGQTTAQISLWDVEAQTINGTLGCGTLCSRAPEYDIFSENIKDTINFNNGAFVGDHHEFFFIGPSTGSAVHTLLDMRQAGPITPDTALTTHGVLAQKQPSIGVFNPWLSLNNTAGGSIDGGGIVRPLGLAYGGNPKVTLAGQDTITGVPGAAMWAALVANGEVDLGIEPSHNTITATGSVTVGDTLSIAIGSTVNPGFGTITVSTIAKTGDTLGLLMQNLCGEIRHNTTLNADGVGSGCYGASDTLSNQVNISWPLTSLIGTGGSTDVTITPTVTGAGTEILTLGTPVPGASARFKTGQTFVQLKLDGSNGFGNDAVWIFGKQSNGAGWSSGGWRGIWEIGGGGAAPFDDVNSQDIEPSTWPMRFDADLIMFVAQTNVSGAPDGPIQNMQLHSVVDARIIDFLTAGGGPVLSPGYQLWGNGDQTIGSGTLSRLTGSASAAGVVLSANGWEGTAVALVSGGGSGCGTNDPGCLLHRYYPKDICPDNYGGLYQIDTVGTIGEVLTFHPVVSGTHTGYPSAAAGSVPATNQAVIGCSGTGWVNGITWTAGNTVRIGGSGQTVDIQGTISGSGITSISTNSTTPRTLAARGADVINVKDFGAVGDGTIDDAGAINAAFTEARTILAGGSAAFNGIEVHFPYGVYNLTSAGINATGLNTYPFTVPVAITGDGATIKCSIGSAACFDMLGDSDVHVHGILIRGVGNGVTNPTTGIQMGRISSHNSDRNVMTNTEVTGSFTQGACVNLGAETTLWSHVQCENSASAANAAAALFDPSNHYNVVSAFVTQTITPDTPGLPMNDMVCDVCDFRNTVNNGPVLWAGGWLFRTTLRNTYLLTNGTGIPLVLDTSTNAMYDLDLEFFAEIVSGTLAHDIEIVGSGATPTIRGFKFNEQTTKAQTSILQLGGSVTSVTLEAANIHIDNSLIGTIPLFDTAANYKLYGDVALPANADWTLPAAYAGRLDLGTAHRYETTVGSASSGGGYRIAGAIVLAVPSADPAHSIYGGGGQTSVLTTGSYDTAFGVNSLAALTTGNFNAALGEEALHSVATTSGHVGIGYLACTNATGAGETCIGANTGATLTSGSRDILIGGTIDVPAAATSDYLNIGNVIAGTVGTGTHPNVCVIGNPCIIGQLRSANFNVTTDQAITVGPLTTTDNGYLPSATKYKITDIFVTNCSTSLTTAQGAFYTAASKGGTIIGATTTPYTGCTGATTQQDATSLTNMNTTIFTSTTLQLSLTTAQGGAATGDVYIVGIPFN